jgi:UDP-glucose 4-epimerase
VFTEAMHARRVPSGGFARDSVDIEGYVRSFARRRPDVDVVALRFTNFIGPRIDSLMTGFFRMPLVPTALGYDARVQLLHEDDALAVLVRATTGDFTGTVNVGGEGTMLLSQAVRRLGRIQVPLPTPTLGSIGRISRRFGFVDYSPEQMRFLNFGRVVDTTVLRTEFGYTPAYTTESALADYARTVQPVVPPRLIGALTERARAVVDTTADAVAAVGERISPTPPAPGLRAVRDA